jgi:hypothetical protein
MNLIQSFVSIAQVAAEKEEQHKNVASNVGVHPKLPSLEIVQQQQIGNVKLHFLQAEKKTTA